MTENLGTAFPINISTEPIRINNIDKSRVSFACRQKARATCLSIYFMEQSEGSVDFYTLGIEYIPTFTDKGSVQIERLISA